MGDRASSSPAPKRPAALRQLSGTLSAPLVDAGAPLRAALAGAHAPQTGGSGVLSFAARAALDPSNPEASLELFKRWRAMERPSPVKPEQPQQQQEQEQKQRGEAGPQRPVSDSARATETEGGTPTSQRSLLGSIDEAWGGAPAAPPSVALPPAQQAPPPPPQWQPEPGGGDAAAGEPASPPERLQPGRLVSAHLEQLSAFHSSAVAGSAAGLEATAPASLDAPAHAEEGGLPPGGADTPRSAASWGSVLSSTHAWLQADAELEHLPPAELERLAAEAAELQARAAAALRQARARLQGDGSAGVEAAPLAAAGPAEPGTAAEAAAVHAEQEAAPAAATGEPAVPASEGAAGAAEPAAELGEPTGPLLLAPALAELAAMAEGTACSRVEPVATQPAELPRLLRLCALLVTLTELALLASAAVVRRGSCGLVRPPQRLVLLPADAMRWAAAALLLGVGAAAGVREALASGRTVRRS